MNTTVATKDPRDFLAVYQHLEARCLRVATLPDLMSHKDYQESDNPYDLLSDIQGHVADMCSSIGEGCKIGDGYQNAIDRFEFNLEWLEEVFGDLLDAKVKS